MKTSVHLEFGDRELEDFASRVAAKWAVKTLSVFMDSLDGALPDLFQAFKSIAVSFGQTPQSSGPASTTPQPSGPAPTTTPPMAPMPKPDAPDDVIAAWYRSTFPDPPATPVPEHG
jgi:hypothetical protein